MRNLILFMYSKPISSDSCTDKLRPTKHYICVVNTKLIFPSLLTFDMPIKRDMADVKEYKMKIKEKNHYTQLKFSIQQTVC